MDNLRLGITHPLPAEAKRQLDIQTRFLAKNAREVKEAADRKEGRERAVSESKAALMRSTPGRVARAVMDGTAEAAVRAGFALLQNQWNEEVELITEASRLLGIPTAASAAQTLVTGLVKYIWEHREEIKDTGRAVGVNLEQSLEHLQELGHDVTLSFRNMWDSLVEWGPSVLELVKRFLSQVKGALIWFRDVAVPQFVGMGRQVQAQLAAFASGTWSVATGVTEQVFNAVLALRSAANTGLQWLFASNNPSDYISSGVRFMAWLYINQMIKAHGGTLATFLETYGGNLGSVFADWLKTAIRAGPFIRALTAWQRGNMYSFAFNAIQCCDIMREGLILLAGELGETFTANIRPFLDGLAAFQSVLGWPGRLWSGLFGTTSPEPEGSLLRLPRETKTLLGRDRQLGMGAPSPPAYDLGSVGAVTNAQFERYLRHEHSFMGFALHDRG
jgi:hypothetical protein